MKATNPDLADASLRDIFLGVVQQLVPLGREQTPEDIGHLVTFLCSDVAASSITGQRHQRGRWDHSGAAKAASLIPIGAPRTFSSFGSVSPCPECVRWCVLWVLRRCEFKERASFCWQKISVEILEGVVLYAVAAPVTVVEVHHSAS